MKRRKLGDVYAITLPDSSYRFGRLLHDDAIQIFRQPSGTLEFNPQIMRDVDFTVAIYRSAFKDSRLVFVTNIPFQNEDESWPPKTYLHHILNDTYSVYNRGQIFPSTKNECANLEPTAVWELEHIIDRITGRVDWIEKGKQAEQYKAD